MIMNSVKLLSLLFVGALTLYSCNPEKAVDSRRTEILNDDNNYIDTIHAPLDSAIMSFEAKDGNQITQNYDLQFVWYRKGEQFGESPKVGDVVILSHTQQPVGGKIFDRSDRNRIPAAVMLGLDIILPAWQEAIMKLHVGDSVKLIIPSAMAYPEEEIPQLFPPGSDLEVHMRLDDIVKDTTLASGVKIARFFEGQGVKPLDGSKVTIQYRAFHRTGKMYDMSAKNGGPFSFYMGQGNMMPGLMEACHHLRVGDWAYVSIPAKEAYGSKGLSNLVPPNMDVVYFLEIVSVE
jgi:FKBP-type peptidyl-prolyl cis-trans isomerase FkpA